MPPSEQSDLDPDTAFALLSNARRRHVLCLLAERDEELSLKTVTTEVIERLEDIDEEEVDDGTYRSVYVSLYQNHLPRLDEAGVIHYDEEERTVRIAHNRKMWELLRLAGAESRGSWRGAYLLLLVVTLLTAVISYGAPARLLSEPWVLPAVVLVAGLTLIGGYQYYTRYRIETGNCGGLIE